MKKIILLVNLAILLVSCKSIPSTKPTVVLVPTNTFISPISTNIPIPTPTLIPPTQTPTVDESISIVLSAYSQDLSNDNISNVSLYSSPMKALLQERKLFYNEFFSMALHSDLVTISSTYDIRSITKDTKHENTFIVKAAELIHFNAKYRLEPGGHPLINAANWAIAHTDNPDVKKRLQEYIAMYETESRKNSTDGYETGFGVEHTFVILNEKNNFQIIQDSYTDANPQDNPKGTDVIEWQDGMFTRRKPDYTGYPDYSIYHTSIEELGKSLLNDYSK